MKEKPTKLNIAVIGGHKCSKTNARIAYGLGQLIAQQGWVLVCGGRGGIMAAACQGAKSAAGITVGILPSYDGKDANRFIDIKIPTGLGYARNVLVVRAADVVIALKGFEGTLSEMSFALSERKLVLGINTWEVKGVVKIKDAYAAIQYIKRKIRGRLKR